MEKETSPYCNCLYYSANALSRIMTKMADEEFAITGLSASYAFLLMSVNNNPGITPTRISQHMQLTPSTVTRLIEKMEHKGFVERQQSGRNTKVYPTEASLAKHDKIKLAWKNLYNKYTAVLGEELSKKLTTVIYETSQQLT